MPEPRYLYLCLVAYSFGGIPHPPEILGASDDIEKAKVELYKLYDSLGEPRNESVDENGWPIVTGVSPMKDPSKLEIIKRAIPAIDADDSRPALYFLMTSSERHDPHAESDQDDKAEYFPSTISEVYTDLQAANEAGRKSAMGIAKPEDVDEYEEDTGPSGAMTFHAFLKSGMEHHFVVKVIPEDTW